MAEMEFQNKVCEFIGRTDTKLEVIEKRSDEHKKLLKDINLIQIDHETRMISMERKQIKWVKLFKWLFLPKKGLIPTLLAGGSFATWLVMHMGG